MAATLLAIVAALCLTALVALIAYVEWQDCKRAPYNPTVPAPRWPNVER